MEGLFIQLLGNSPVLIAVLLMYGKFDKRCALIEQDLKFLEKEQKCLKKLKKN